MFFKCNDFPSVNLFINSLTFILYVFIESILLVSGHPIILFTTNFISLLVGLGILLNCSIAIYSRDDTGICVGTDGICGII